MFVGHMNTKSFLHDLRDIRMKHIVKKGLQNGNNPSSSSNKIMQNKRTVKRSTTRVTRNHEATNTEKNCNIIKWKDLTDTLLFCMYIFTYALV